MKKNKNIIFEQNNYTKYNKEVNIVGKKKHMLKNIEDKIEDMGHDMASGIKSFSNSVEHAGEKMVKDVKNASKKMFKK